MNSAPLYQSALSNRPKKVRSGPLLLLLAFGLVALTPAAVASIPAEFILFRPAPYLDALESGGYYREYPQLMLDFLASGGDLFAPGLGSWVMGVFNPQDVQGTLRFLFPEDWVRSQTGALVENFWGYYNFEREDLSLVVDFQPVKQRLSSTQSLALVQSALGGWPSCSAQDLVQLGLAIAQGSPSAAYPHCRPPQPLEGLLEQLVQSSLSTFAGALPAQVWIVPPRSGSAGTVYLVLRWAMRLAPLGYLALCLAGAALLGFSWRRAAAWISLPLYTGGLACALFAAAAVWLAGGLIPAAGLPFPRPAAELTAFALGVILTVARRFLVAAALSSLGLALAGLVLYWLTRRVPERA